MGKAFHLKFVIAALLSLHVTMFAAAVLLDLLVFDSMTAKVAASLLAALSWWGVHVYWPPREPRQPPVTIRRTVR